MTFMATVNGELVPGGSNAPWQRPWAFRCDDCGRLLPYGVAHYTAEDNGLWRSWDGQRCWMNPPYGRDTQLWVHKAYKEAQLGALVVGLIPARTDTAWFHQYVLRAGAEVRFVRGRVRFELPNRLPDGRCPFPSLIVVWRPAQWIGVKAA